MGQGPAECIECMRHNQCSLRRVIDYGFYHLKTIIKSTHHCHRTLNRPRSRPPLTTHPLFKWNQFTNNFLVFSLICKYYVSHFFFNPVNFLNQRTFPQNKFLRVGRLCLEFCLVLCRLFTILVDFYQFNTHISFKWRSKQIFLNICLYTRALDRAVFVWPRWSSNPMK